MANCGSVCPQPTSSASLLKQLAEILFYKYLPGCWVTTYESHIFYQWPMWCIWFIFDIDFVIDQYCRAAFLLVEGAQAAIAAHHLDWTNHSDRCSHVSYGLQTTLVPQSIESGVRHHAPSALTGTTLNIGHSESPCWLVTLLLILWSFLVSIC